MLELSKIILVTEIHAQRIQEALSHIGHFFPIGIEVLLTLQFEDFAKIELLINRFGKLQDLIGSRLIDCVLQKLEEIPQSGAMLDKIYALERLHLIKNSNLWKTMREVRNHIAHEYPDQPELTAHYLNQIFMLTPELLELYNTLKKVAQQPGGL